MNTKRDLQRECRLRYFIRSVLNNAESIDDIPTVDNADSKLEKLLNRIHELDWTDVVDVRTGCTGFRDWLALRKVAIICWVPDAGGFVHCSTWFKSHLENLVNKSDINLLLTTTDLNHGVAMLKCEYSIGMKRW